MLRFATQITNFSYQFGLHHLGKPRNQVATSYNFSELSPQTSELRNYDSALNMYVGRLTKLAHEKLNQDTRPAQDQSENKSTLIFPTAPLNPYSADCFSFRRER